MDKKNNNIPIATEVYNNQDISSSSSYIIEPSAPPYICMTSETVNDNNIIYNSETIQIEREEEYCGPISCCICIMMSVLFWPLALCVPLCPCDKKKKIIKIVNRQ